ncbi:MAG: polyphosphate polymerase domain-containing protein [Oscillospiraceae bacterium]|nr:polyphosphate polymerase domain-containing protein [Oscillospiraceae bacterium]
MATEVFNRRENKYLLDEASFIRIQDRLSHVMAPDTHNASCFTYPICNIYYDTPDSSLIRASLGKPSYKEKLRLRSYGTPDVSSEVFVEIKKKYRGIVNKRRSSLLLPEAYVFLDSGVLPQLQPYMNGQVLREVEYLLSRLRLLPKTCISYERRALFGTDGSDLRVSFDTNILTRRDNLRLESGIYGEPLLRDGQWLMEIKTAGAFPVWLAGLLSEMRIYPVSFSKYGAEYMRTLQNARSAQTGTVTVFRSGLGFKKISVCEPA